MKDNLIRGIYGIYKLYNTYVKVQVKATQSCPTLCDPMDYPVHGINTGVVSHSLLQGIFPTQGLNLGLPHCRQILYQLSHQGSQKNTGVACHAFLQGIFSTQGSNPGLQHSGRSLTDWATREAQRKWKSLSRIWLFVTPWTIQSMELSRSEYWSG